MCLGRVALGEGVGGGAILARLQECDYEKSELDGWMKCAEK